MHRFLGFSNAYPNSKPIVPSSHRLELSTWNRPLELSRMYLDSRKGIVVLSLLKDA